MARLRDNRENIAVQASKAKEIFALERYCHPQLSSVERLKLLISMRWFRYLSAVFLLAAALQAAERPNILLIITDDQRFDQMGNMNPLIHTPEMDRIVQEGARFENAFVTSPICAASRASILCGLVERTHRYTFKTPPLANSLALQSFPKLLRDAGYRTAHVGKFGVNLRPGTSHALYDQFLDLNRNPYWKPQPDGSLRHLTDLEGDAAMRFLDDHANNSEGRPFCLTVSFNAPHAEDSDPLQYHWQKEVDLLYRDLKVPKPPLAEAGFYAGLPEFLRDGTMNRHRWYWRFDIESKRQQMTKGYWRMISGVDLVIGRLRQKLEELAVADQTVIILVGDNGYFLGERGYAGKWLPYEQSIRVPLLMHDPSGRFVQAGAKPRQLVANIDIAPTLLDLAGLPVPEAMQGRSLVPLARGLSPDDWREEIWIEHLMMESSIRKHEGIRTSRHKFSRYFEASPVLEELYDLEVDPLETVNLASKPEHQALLHDLRQRTDARRDRYGGHFCPQQWLEPQP
jgi:arylsulfatase A-like enzyme